MRLCTLVLITVLISIFGGSCGPNIDNNVMFHVDPDGDDANPGTVTAPFASLARAISAAREVTDTRDRAILMHDGAFFDTEVILTHADSGLVITAAPDARPVLYGGRRVTGWKSDGDFMAAALPGVTEGEWDFRALIVNGRLAKRARLPREDAFRHESVFDVRWMSSTAGGWERKPTEAELTTMQYHAGDLGPWLDVANAELTIYHAWDESMVGLSAIDTERRIVTFSIPSGHPPGAFGSWMDKANTYVIWNVREGMHEPGRWYLDRTNGRVVYYPLPGENVERSLVIAPTTTSVITLEEGTRDITLRNLTIACTTTPLITGGFGAGAFPGAVQVRGAVNCRFEDLVVEKAGGWAFNVRGDDIRIERCEIAHIGAGGIHSRGDRITVTDCHMHHIGEIYPSAIGILGGGTALDIVHNEFHHTPYSALHISADGGLIEANVFHDTMQVLNDGAAIYIGFADSIMVRKNTVRGSRGAGPAHAYYIDERGIGCVVEHNLAVDTAWPSHNHMTIDCTIRNNLFIDSGNQLLTFPRTSGMTFERNICIADTIVFRYPTGKTVTEEDAQRLPESIRRFAYADGITAMPNNILYSRNDTVTFIEIAEYRQLTPRSLESRDGTLYKDPLVIDHGDGLYTFSEGSPAHALGIEPIDVRGAGIRPRVETSR